jgi:hypothetical protein
MEQHVLLISIDYRDHQWKVTEIYNGTEGSLQQFFWLNKHKGNFEHFRKVKTLKIFKNTFFNILFTFSELPSFNIFLYYMRHADPLI